MNFNYFVKNSVLELVVKQVMSDNKNNAKVLALKLLIEQIKEGDFNPTLDFWEDYDLIITDDENKRFLDKQVIITKFPSELSWLLGELYMIMKPDKNSIDRFLNTFEYMVDTYTVKYKEIKRVMQMTAITMIVFLHPDHISEDKFKITPIKLPNFGAKF